MGSGEAEDGDSASSDEDSLTLMNLTGAALSK